MLFAKKLISWYLENKRDLPWRKTSDPYKIWLSEIMLQQTRVAQGMPYYNRFLKEFPTVFDLAAASEDEVLKQWQGLGYYTRARNLQAAARFVANELKGNFPRNYKSLLELKGVGDYTASAIASFCYEEAVAVVDGNVFRVLSRIFGIDTPVNTSEGKRLFKELAEQLLDRKNSSIFNQAIMEFGALHCTPRKPLCGTCPFANDCIGYNQNKISLLPVKLKKQKVRKRYFNYLVFVTKEQRTILKQRKGKGIWEGLYEFPLVETPYEATAENLVKEDEWPVYSTSAETFPHLFNEKPIVHKLSHQHLHTKFWIVSCQKLPEEAISFKEITNFPVPALIEKFIDSYGF